jgi:hypothetical protein
MVKNTKGGSSHKKLARKNEDENKTIKVDLDINFNECCIVLIDKNLGNCFTSKVLHYTGPKREINDKEIKVLHQRGKAAKKTYDRSQSRVALVSLVSDFRLTSGCLGYVEDILEIQHLNAYLKNSLITKEVYDRLIGLLVSKVIEVDNEDGGGYSFDRGNNEVTGEFINEIKKGSIEGVEEEKEEEIELDDL